MTIRLGLLEFDHVVYDEKADVLYLNVGEPTEAARQEATPEGHVVRYEGDGKIEVTVRVDAVELAPALT